MVTGSKIGLSRNFCSPNASTTKGYSCLPQKKKLHDGAFFCTHVYRKKKVRKVTILLDSHLPQNKLHDSTMFFWICIYCKQNFTTSNFFLYLCLPQKKNTRQCRFFGLTFTTKTVETYHFLYCIVFFVLVFTTQKKYTIIPLFVLVFSAKKDTCTYNKQKISGH